MKHLGYILMVVVLSAKLTGADASTLVNEEQFGDFNGGQLFALSEGANWFIGSHGFNTSDPFDGFRFIVPDGYKTTVNFSYSFPGLGDSESMAWVWELSALPQATSCDPMSFEYECVLDPNRELLASQIFQTPADYINPDNWNYNEIQGFILDPGVYLLNDNYGFSDSVNATLAYSINLQTAAVPVPSSLLLFISSIISLGAFFTKLPNELMLAVNGHI